MSAFEKLNPDSRSHGRRAGSRKLVLNSSSVHMGSRMLVQHTSPLSSSEQMKLSTGDRLRETPEISNRRKENKSIRRAGGKPQVRTLCCGSVVSETGLCWVSRLAQNWMSRPSNSKGGEVTATFSAASMDVKTSSVFK